MAEQRRQEEERRARLERERQLEIQRQRQLEEQRLREEQEKQRAKEERCVLLHQLVINQDHVVSNCCPMPTLKQVIYESFDFQCTNDLFCVDVL